MFRRTINSRSSIGTRLRAAKAPREAPKNSWLPHAITFDIACLSAGTHCAAQALVDAGKLTTGCASEPTLRLSSGLMESVICDGD